MNLCLHEKKKLCAKRYHARKTDTPKDVDIVRDEIIQHREQPVPVQDSESAGYGYPDNSRQGEEQTHYSHYHHSHNEETQNTKRKPDLHTKVETSSTSHDEQDKKHCGANNERRQKENSSQSHKKKLNNESKANKQDQEMDIHNDERLLGKEIIPSSQLGPHVFRGNKQLHVRNEDQRQRQGQTEEQQQQQQQQEDDDDDDDDDGEEEDENDVSSSSSSQSHPEQTTQKEACSEKKKELIAASKKFSRKKISIMKKIEEMCEQHPDCGIIFVCMSPSQRVETYSNMGNGTDAVMTKLVKEHAFAILKKEKMSSRATETTTLQKKSKNYHCCRQTKHQNSGSSRKRTMDSSGDSSSNGGGGNCSMTATIRGESDTERGTLLGMIETGEHQYEINGTIQIKKQKLTHK